MWNELSSVLDSLWFSRHSIESKIKLVECPYWLRIEKCSQQVIALDVLFILILVPNNIGLMFKIHQFFVMWFEFEVQANKHDMPVWIAYELFTWKVSGCVLSNSWQMSLNLVLTSFVGYPEYMLDTDFNLCRPNFLCIGPHERSFARKYLPQRAFACSVTSAAVTGAAFHPILVDNLQHFEGTNRKDKENANTDISLWSCLYLSVFVFPLRHSKRENRIDKARSLIALNLKWRYVIIRYLYYGWVNEGLFIYLYICIFIVLFDSIYVWNSV